MAQTKEGALKIAAARAGLTLDAYTARIAAGEKRCTGCKAWHPRSVFQADGTRYDGLSASCSEHRKRTTRRPLPHKSRANPLTGRPGTAPHPPRDGDKKQARQRVNVEVRQGFRPHPNTLPCTDCGHIWQPGERRHEYDHHKGYASAHHLDVEPVCTKCHGQRGKVKLCCKRGHAFDEQNTVVAKNGTRHCRGCRRAKDRKRTRPPGYWKAVWQRRRERAA